MWHRHAFRDSFPRHLWWSRNSYLAKLLLMILFLLRLLIIVVVAAIFLVLLSRKLSGALPSSSQPSAELAVVPSV